MECHLCVCMPRSGLETGAIHVQVANHSGRRRLAALPDGEENEMVESEPRSGWHATTILMVRKGGRVVIGGDGQVSLGQTVIKAMPARCAGWAMGM